MKKPLSFGMTMLASALGVVVVSLISGLLFFLMMIVMLVSVGTMSKEDASLAKNGTFLTVDLDKISGDRTADPLTRALGEGNSIGLVDACRNIRSAADDNNIQGILVKDNGGPGISWASLEELRTALSFFRQSGKPVVAYATGYSQPGYYLASCADVVSLHPTGMVDFRGLGGEVLYIKDLLDKLGVEMQLIRPESCAYKSAGETYTLDHMSAANREQIRTYLGSIWRTVVADIAASRSIDTATLLLTADNLAGYLAADACKAGLVDTLCFEEDVRTMLKTQYGGRHLMGIERYTAADAKKTSDRIAVVFAEGDVVDGSSKGIGTAVFGDDIVKALKQAADDDNVKAIVLRVNSPGGQASASESMTHAVIAAREKKPVVVSMGDLAASAGYEISCMANAIVAQPMTITGSIGVFATIPNAQKLMHQKLGINADTIGTNRNANGLSIARPLSPSAKALMYRNVEDFYSVFVGRVAEGRHMSADEVHKVARGRVWTGADAVGIGLVDELGGLDLALTIAADLAGIDNYKVKNYPDEKDPWTLLAELFGEESNNDIDLLAKSRLAYRWYTAKRQLQPLTRIEQETLRLSESSGLQARLPYLFLAY